MPSLHNTGPGLRIPVSRQVTLAWDRGATKHISDEHAAHPDVARYIESGRLVVDAESRTPNAGLPSRNRGAGVTPAGFAGTLPPRKNGVVQSTPARAGRARNPLPSPAVPSPSDPITHTPLLVPEPVVSVIDRPAAPPADAAPTADAVLVRGDTDIDLDAGPSDGIDPLPATDTPPDEDGADAEDGARVSDGDAAASNDPAPADPAPLPKTRRSRRS